MVSQMPRRRARRRIFSFRESSRIAAHDQPAERKQRSNGRPMLATRYSFIRSSPKPRSVDDHTELEILPPASQNGPRLVVVGITAPCGLSG